MKIAYIGNFGPVYSTENHVLQALQGLEHEVVPLQENSGLGVWEFNPRDYDLVLWTRTGWPWPSYGLETEHVYAAQRSLLITAAARGVPTVGFHLDRWWGLPREFEITVEPFFQVALLITADGGHSENWKAAGVNHVWMPPAVSLYECEMGTPSTEYSVPLAFVGSWSSYHPEWMHRIELIDHLRSLGCRMWPNPGEAVRGVELRNLYASTSVNVGDSCLLGGIERYWSDRIPETLGRGGFLLHPNVVGLEEHFTPGEHLATWDLWDWAQMEEQIRHYLNYPEERQRVSAQGRQHVIEKHTYHARMQALLDLL